MPEKVTLRERIQSEIARRRPRSLARSGGGAIEGLRDTWSRYPSEWERDARLNLGYTTLGEEWGGPAFADFVVELAGEHLGPDKDVLELGCGGGKFSLRLAPRCRSLLCTDISEQMIVHTRRTLSERGLGGNVSYRVLNGVDFDGVENESVDLIFSYDVLLHLQPQNVFSYMLDGRRVLREGGVFMLHQINLASNGGMTHFLGQYAAGTWKYGFDDPRRRGHIYYASVDQMRVLAAMAGLAEERLFWDEEPLRRVTGGRDLIAFLAKRRGRLDGVDRGAVRLIKLRDRDTVHAVLGGRRLRFVSAHQFERHGLRWERVEEVGAEELEAIPDGGPLEPWE